MSGCIYTVDAEEGEYIPFKNMPCARLGVVPLDVVGCIEVPDAYELMQRYIAAGRLRVSRFEDKTPEQLEGWYKMVASYLKATPHKDRLKTLYATYLHLFRHITHFFLEIR